MVEEDTGTLPQRVLLLLTLTLSSFSPLDKYPIQRYTFCPGCKEVFYTIVAPPPFKKATNKPCINRHDWKRVECGVGAYLTPGTAVIFSWVKVTLPSVQNFSCCHGFRRRHTAAFTVSCESVHVFYTHQPSLETKYLHLLHNESIQLPHYTHLKAFRIVSQHTILTHTVAATSNIYMTDCHRWNHWTTLALQNCNKTTRASWRFSPKWALPERNPRSGEENKIQGSSRTKEKIMPWQSSKSSGEKGQERQQRGTNRQKNNSRDI